MIVAANDLAVGFAPVLPAEFVIFGVVQDRGLFAGGFESGDLGAWTN